MLDTYAFYAIAAIAVVSSVFVFIEKKLIHAVVALSIAFVGSALLFFLLGQSLIGILQLIVFVGGFSTYLIVAIASEEKNAMVINLPAFIIAAIIISAGLAFVLFGYLPSSSVQGSPSFLSAATVAFQGSYALFYLMATLLFAVAISGVLIIRKFTRLVV